MRTKRSWLLLAALQILVGCTARSVDTPFTLRVIPQELKGFAIAGQEIHYLVTLQEDASEQPVKITASSSSADLRILPEEISQAQVAEVVAIPKAESIGQTVEVVIEGQRGTVRDSHTMTFEVIEGEDDRKERAEELLVPFVAFLAENHPEFKITQDTEWTWTMVSPQWLVVSHYLFFSEEWELHLEWHVMIAPHDWAKIDLRHRSDEVVPSAAFEISSVSAGTTPVPIDAPPEVWR